MTYYSPSEIRKRRAQQIGMGYAFPGYYSSLSDAYISACANGVGPDAAPSGVRGLLTALLPYADLAADIHDVEFQRADKGGPEGKAGFRAANERFRHNCRRWIIANRGRLNPLRYIELSRLARDVDILNSDAGWSAWVAAWTRNINAGESA